MKGEFSQRGPRRPQILALVPEGASTMPGKSDEERAIVAIICWPPVLRGDDGLPL